MLGGAPGAGGIAGQMAVMLGAAATGVMKRMEELIGGMVKELRGVQQ